MPPCAQVGIFTGNLHSEMSGGPSSMMESMASTTAAAVQSSRPVSGFRGVGMAAPASGSDVHGPRVGPNSDVPGPRVGPDGNWLYATYSPSTRRLGGGVGGGAGGDGGGGGVVGSSEVQGVGLRITPARGSPINR